MASVLSRRCIFRLATAFSLGKLAALALALLPYGWPGAAQVYEPSQMLIEAISEIFGSFVAATVGAAASIRLSPRYSTVLTIVPVLFQTGAALALFVLSPASARLISYLLGIHSASEGWRMFVQWQSIGRV